MTWKNAIWLVLAGAALKLIDPSTQTLFFLGLMVAVGWHSFYTDERSRAARELAESFGAKIDAIAESLRGIDTSTRIRHDPELERVATALGYEAALTMPRARAFYDYDGYLEALAKWKDSLPIETAKE